MNFELRAWAGAVVDFLYSEHARSISNSSKFDFVLGTKMLSRFAVLLLIPAVCFISGCGGGGGGDNVQGDFSSGEMKEFKDEFVQVVKDLIAKGEADGKAEFLADAPALQQRVYDKYPQNAGASENAITDLIDRLDVIMDEANESQIDETTSLLQKLLAEVEAL